MTSKSWKGFIRFSLIVLFYFMEGIVRVEKGFESYNDRRGIRSFVFGFRLLR